MKGVIGQWQAETPSRCRQRGNWKWLLLRPKAQRQEVECSIESRKKHKERKISKFLRDSVRLGDDIARKLGWSTRAIM